MRMFECLIGRETNTKEPQEYTLTGDELVEYLNNETFTVYKAEKIQVDRDKIKETIQSKLQEAYGEILSHHSLHTGDITPLEQEDMDSKEDQVVEATTDWIERRLN